MASKGALFILVILLLFGTGNNPKGEQFEKDVKVCEGETATLDCGTGGHKASYRWRFGSRRPVPKKTDKYEQLQNGAILLVKNVDHSDIAKMKYISCQTHLDFRRITHLYRILINCENFQTPVGSSVKLPCKVDIPDGELDYIRWTFIFKRHSKIERINLFKKHGKATTSSSLTFNGRITAQNRTLIIQNIKMEDVGTYHCLAYRKKNFHLGNPSYHYNVNVTARTTTKPIAVNTTDSTNTITLGPNIGYTVEPAKTVPVNTTSQPQFTTPTTPIRKTVDISSGNTVLLTTPTTSSRTLSVKTSVVQTNTRSTVLTTKMPRPTTTSLLNKRFSKPKDLLPTTSDNVNSNKTLKQDDGTPNGSSSKTAPLKWLFIFLFLNLVICQLSYA